MIRRLWAGLLAALLLLTSWTAAIAEDPYLTEEELAESFATPAAVQDPPKTGDENIFNIISPTDAVPQVMPADWNLRPLRKGSVSSGAGILQHRRNGCTGTQDLLPGVVLLWLGHVLLIVSFIRKKPISRTLWIQWAVLSVLAAVLMILVFAPEAAAIAWATAAFIPVLSLMFYSADGQSHQIRHAAGCLLVSDILLGLYLSILNEPVAHILHVMLFCVALILLAFGESNPEEAAPGREIPTVR